MQKNTFLLHLASNHICAMAGPGEHKGTVGIRPKYVKTPVYSKRPLWYGTLAQLARAAAEHREAVKSKRTIP